MNDGMLHIGLDFYFFLENKDIIYFFNKNYRKKI